MVLELWQFACIALVGLIAGIINGTVGGGSLLTYPVLVAFGVPPVYAAATNTTGLMSGNLGALIPHRSGETVAFAPWKWHALTTAVGAVVGGLLLILLPAKVFEFIVPILLVFASLSVMLRPRQHSGQQAHPRQTKGLLFFGGIYNGYFGPGQGVIAMAVLLRDGRLSIHQVIVIKNFVIAASNVVVATLFIATGHVLWSIALTLLICVGMGGWAGGKLAHRVNQNLLRWLVCVGGLAAAAWFVFGR